MKSNVTYKLLDLILIKKYQTLSFQIVTKYQEQINALNQNEIATKQKPLVDQCIADLQKFTYSFTAEHKDYLELIHQEKIGVSK